MLHEEIKTRKCKVVTKRRRKEDSREAVKENEGKMCTSWKVDDVEINETENGRKKQKTKQIVREMRIKTRK